MKILIAIGVRRVREAGAAGVAFSHAEELEKRGHKVELWFFDDVLKPAKWPARFHDLEFAVAVSRKIRCDPRQFDVVNIHAPWGCIYGCSRKLFSSAQLPPYVFTMQGCEERYTLAMGIENRKGRAHNFAFKNRFWHRIYHQTLYDISISTADYGAVANREGWLLSELKYGHSSGHIWYVPNGTSVEFFQPRVFNESPPNRLLFVGTWVDRKGIYYLADAFGTLASLLPEITLTVAGCTAPEVTVKSYFPNQFHDRIAVYPNLRREEMRTVYASHDIFVFPSLVEGMPLVLLEAMATAMPVVTTSSSGMADVIENEYNGLLVPAADSSSFSAAIERLYRDPQLRQRLGLCGQATAGRYSWQNIAAQMEHILRTAASGETSAAMR